MMSLEEKVVIVSSLELLKQMANRVPEIAPFAAIAIDTAIDAINSNAEDPLAVLQASREDLKNKVADAMKAKFPNG